MKILIRFVMLILVIMLCVVCYSASVGNIKLSCRDFYLKGCKIPITVSYTVDAMTAFDLQTSLILPDFVMEEVVDPKGQTLQFNNVNFNSTSGIHSDQSYSLKKGMELLFERDLSKNYTFSYSGEYKYILYVDINDKKQLLAESKFLIIDTEIQSFYINKDLKMVDFSIVKTTDLKINNWYLKCNKKNVNILNCTYYSVPINTKIINVICDFNNNIWIILENDKKFTLLLWNKEIKEYQILLPWGEKNIIMGTTLLNNYGLSFVLAGREGEPWFTSSSISPLHTTYIE
jgi:hypothetical protein